VELVLGGACLAYIGVYWRRRAAWHVERTRSLVSSDATRERAFAAAAGAMAALGALLIVVGLIRIAL
jgi:hypothetical protein